MSFLAVETTVRIAVYEISLALRHADPESAVLPFLYVPAFSLACP